MDALVRASLGSLCLTRISRVPWAIPCVLPSELGTPISYTGPSAQTFDIVPQNTERLAPFTSDIGSIGSPCRPADLPAGAAADPSETGATKRTLSRLRRIDMPSTLRSLDCPEPASAFGEHFHTWRYSHWLWVGNELWAYAEVAKPNANQLRNLRARCTVQGTSRLGMRLAGRGRTDFVCPCASEGMHRARRDLC